ncbi:ABC transporter permease [Saccharibacillus alkalitolerans]|uniref:ABC transporter permease subunit n=1 Tax=Saccharibacillus alkalitolerans TaxID=2705290 RepID=A0ABX0F8Q6_9BACL|nr:ABC transporter permease [Saccharibacillus alkalitolerans]NGZ77341.1 ABC transporter permease subunit [Saccharibacillus alkalitolerans]
MIGKLLSTDLLKMRRTGIWWVVLIGPVGLAAMQALNFGLRYDYLVRGRYAADPWSGLLNETAMFVPIAVYLAMTLLMAMIANIENKQNSWKQMLALPVRRSQVFASKFLCCLIQLLAACALLSVSTAAVGLALNFSGPIPYADLLTFGVYPMLASLPMLGFTLWLTLTFRNQAIPISLGIAASLMSVFGASMPEVVPLAWPALVVSGQRALTFMGLGVGLFAVLYLLGSAHFSRKDVA